MTVTEDYQAFRISILRSKDPHILSRVVCLLRYTKYSLPSSDFVYSD